MVPGIPVPKIFIINYVVLSVVLLCLHMMSQETPTDSAWVRLYSNRIGEPTTGDEVVGYWLFLVGAVLGILGIGLAVVSQPASLVREVAITSGALGLTSIMIGSVIRFPLKPLATYLSYTGAMISVVAVAWFTIVFPSAWSPSGGNPWIIGLYGFGTMIIAIGGVFVPLTTSSRVDKAEAAERRAKQETSDMRKENERMQDRLREAEDRNAELEEEALDSKQSQARFELYRDKSDKYRWRLRHRNGQIIAGSGENFERRNGAQNGIQSVKHNSFGADIIEHENEEVDEEPIEEESNAEFEVYSDKKNEWRWRLKHDNGNIIADGGEGYSSKSNAMRAVDSVMEHLGPATYLEVDPTAFDIYRDEAGEWRWRLIHKNGNILADGGEGYSSRSSVRRAVDTLMNGGESTETEVYRDNAGEHRWRMKRNGEIMADSGEGYSSKSEAQNGLERVEKYAPEADVLDIGEAAFEVYEDRAEEHRWRLRHRNGNILADSGEGYSSRSAAQTAVDRVKKNGATATVVET